MKLEKYLYIKGDFRKKFCPKVGCRMIGFETLTPLLPPPVYRAAALLVHTVSMLICNISRGDRATSEPRGSLSHSKSDLIQVM